MSAAVVAHGQRQQRARGIHVAVHHVVGQQVLEDLGLALELVVEGHVRVRRGVHVEQLVHHDVGTALGGDHGAVLLLVAVVRGRLVVDADVRVRLRELLVDHHERLLHLGVVHHLQRDLLRLALGQAREGRERKQEHEHAQDEEQFLTSHRDVSFPQLPVSAAWAPHADHTIRHVSVKRAAHIARASRTTSFPPAAGPLARGGPSPAPHDPARYLSRSPLMSGDRVSRPFSVTMNPSSIRLDPATG